MSDSTQQTQLTAEQVQERMQALNTAYISAENAFREHDSRSSELLRTRCDALGQLSSFRILVLESQNQQQLKELDDLRSKAASEPASVEEITDRADNVAK